MEQWKPLRDNELTKDDAGQKHFGSSSFRGFPGERLRKEMKMKLNCQLWLLNKQTRYTKRLNRLMIFKINLKVLRKRKNC